MARRAGRGLGKIANYALPAQYVGTGKGLRGTQFVDVDGDGLLDFVLARANGNTGAGNAESETFLNTGTGWASQPLSGPNQVFPVYLSDDNDNPTGVVMTDMDGDGHPDIVVDFANVVCTSAGVGGVGGEINCVSCPVNEPCSDSKKPYSPAVWLNRFTPGGGGGWEFHGEYGIMPPSQPNDLITNPGGIRFVNVSEPSQVADMNGDGKADLIFAPQASEDEISPINVLVNQGPLTGLWSKRRDRTK